VKVTVEVPADHVDPAPEVSQLPLTVQEPVVAVIVPDTPPVMDTFATLTAEAFEVRIPAFPTAKAPPVRLRPLVASVVVPLPAWTVRVPDHTRAFAPIVNETVDAPLLKVTL